MMERVPNRVRLVEVGPRGGLQNENQDRVLRLQSIYCPVAKGVGPSHFHVRTLDVDLRGLGLRAKAMCAGGLLQDAVSWKATEFANNFGALPHRSAQRQIHR